MAPPSNVVVLNSHLNSGSEENPNNTIDEKKQKRMISNRESSRRYRLRKQQHLDELRAQVANLKAENNRMLTRLNFVTQNYMKLHEENIVLKSHALKLQDMNLAEFNQYMDSILLCNENGVV